jgi:hypothetical protein
MTMMRNLTRLTELVAQFLMLLTAGFVTLAGVFGPALVSLLALLDP